MNRSHIYEIYDNDNNLLFSGTVSQIANHFNVAEKTVRNCFQRQGKLLWQYTIVWTKELEDKNELFYF